MNKAFVEFLNRLEKMSGNENLCEAILQGYVACHPIMEDAEGEAASKTRKFIKSKFGETECNEIKTDENGNPILTRNGQEQTVLDYLERQVRAVFFHNNYANIRFEPGIARIAFNDLDFRGRNQDDSGIETLKNILKIISSSHVDEYDKDLNGLSFEQLKTRFGGDVARESEETYNRISGSEYTKNDSYKIVEIHSFDEARKYAKWTEPNTWCITESESAWNSYSGKGGNRVYFVLRDGFENIEPIEGDNCPLDEYGLSMICVIVTNDLNDDTRPMLCTCACRWNHEHGGTDQVMGVEQISNVIGQSFYEAFKPFSIEELHSRGTYTPMEKFEKYKETHDRSLFDDVLDFKEGFAKVRLGVKWNFIDKDGELLWKKELEDWFDDAYAFGEGLAGVILGGKWNYIDKDGELLWKKDPKDWFDKVYAFSDGFAEVMLGGKFNFIGKDGDLLWKGEKWFDEADAFEEGFAGFRLGKKWNFIGTDGEFLWKKEPEDWFDGVLDFEKGFAVAELGGKFNFINKDGELLWKKEPKDWFDKTYAFGKGLAVVELGGKFNFIDKDGEFLWKKEPKDWFDNTYAFGKGLAVVELGEKCNFIDKDGEFLWKKEPKDWFDNTYAFDDEGLAVVELGEKQNFIDKDGELLWKKDPKDWFDEVYYFQERFAVVRLGEKWNFIDRDGEFLWKKEPKDWFDEVYAFNDEGFAEVRLGKKWNFIGEGGNILSKQWFDNIDNFREGYAVVGLRGKENFIDKDGNLLWKGEEWFDRVEYFDEGYADVLLNGKWYRIDKEGNLLS